MAKGLGEFLVLIGGVIIGAITTSMIYSDGPGPIESIKDRLLVVELLLVGLLIVGGVTIGMIAWFL